MSTYIKHKNHIDQDISDGELIIESSVMNETKKCGSNFSCLKGEKSCLCKVDYVVEGELIFIKCLKNPGCSYAASFGYSYYCKCPARKRIYELYSF